MTKPRLGTRAALHHAIRHGDPRDWSFAWRSAEYHVHLFRTMIYWPALSDSFLEDMLLIEDRIRASGLQPPMRIERTEEEVPA